MIDQREQQSEYNSKKSPQQSDQFDDDHRHDHVHEQQTSSEMHPLRSAFPTRAQQERHRHNLRLNGQVEFEDSSVSRHATKEKRRDSWIDRINSSTKEAIRRTSVIAAVDEKKLIDKVADSINDYGEHHQHDSWTDKVLGFLFPSMELDTENEKIKSEKELMVIRAKETPASAFDGKPAPAMTPSDQSYDRVQQSKSIEELMLWAIETADLMDSTDQDAMNHHPKMGMKLETSDQTYDHLQAEYPDSRSVKCYGDALEKQLQIDDHLSMSPSWSVYDDLHQQAITKRHSHSKHRSPWPLHHAVDQNTTNTQSIESAKKDRRRHRQQLRKQGIDTFAT